MTETTVTSCPKCGTALHRPSRGQPWCPACEWNLGVYDPEMRPPRGWLWIEKWGYRLAYRLDAGLVEERRRGGSPPSAWTRSRVTLTVLSALFMLAIVVGLVAGIVLIVAHRSLISTLGGAILIVVAFLFRPRFGRHPRKKQRIDPAAFPALVQLVERVAKHAGTTPPDFIVLNYQWNAAVSMSGIRRRRTLWLGLPLWLTLDEQMKVALLGHEFGHLVNDDPNRDLLVAPVLDSLARIVQWTGAERTLGVVLDADRFHRRSVRRLFSELTMWIISRIPLLLYLGITAIALRDHQRAEYRADALAAEIAGTDGAVRLSNRMLRADIEWRLIRHSAETVEPAGWRGLIAGYERTHRDEVTVLRQASRRETGLWESHPPSGSRAQVLEEAPAREARLVLGPGAAAQIDASLARRYRRLHLRILGGRTFRPTTVARSSAAAADPGLILAEAEPLTIDAEPVHTDGPS